MLYVSTGNPTDSYTAHRALHEISAPDGGMFVPFQLPYFEHEEILRLKEQSFCENVANILNIFFSLRLNAWDVEFCIGRYPAQIVSLPRKLMVAELWHNLSASYTRMERALYARLCGDDSISAVPGWVKIAIKIAILFATYGVSDAAECGNELDLAVESYSFSAPIAAWYARKMGLPIGVIICAGYDGSDVWDLLHRGELNTASMRDDIIGVERLIYMTLGKDEAMRFATACKERKVYSVGDEQLPILNDGLFAAVVSKDRLHSVISNFYRSNGYIPDTFSAISYAALQDYRSKSGESKNTLLLSLECPANYASGLSGILGIPAAQIENIVHHRKG